VGSGDGLFEQTGALVGLQHCLGYGGFEPVGGQPLGGQSLVP
jgi:hypothetical protein